MLGKSPKSDMGSNVVIVYVLALGDLVDKLFLSLFVSEAHERDDGDGQRNSGFGSESIVFLADGSDYIIKVTGG